MEGWIGGIVIGLVLGKLGQPLLKRARPLAKAVIKGGLVVTERAKEGLAETQEQFEDLVAEARSELAEKGEHVEAGQEAAKQEGGS